MSYKWSVSLWLGNTNSQEYLEEYTTIKYNEELEDDDEELSQFLKDFNLDWFDEDFMEIRYFDKNVSDISEFLESCFYEEFLIPKFKEITKGMSWNYNSVIMLLDFDYTSECENIVDSINTKDYNFKYIGTANIDVDDNFCYHQ